MSRWIRLSNSNGRSARMRMETKRMTPPIQFQCDDGRVVTAAKIIKSPLQQTYTHLRSHCNSDQELARVLLEADPEIDTEAAGRKSGPTDRVLLDSQSRVLYAASEIEVVLDSNGNEIERRPPVNIPSNIDTEKPLLWTGKMFKRSEAVRRFVFTRNYQIRHINGLTFDFLLAMAKELDCSDSLVLLGAGPQGKEPLLLERNGLPYRGFLEGRVNGDKYLLILHLAHLELIHLT
jgi:hypothetical protein